MRELLANVMVSRHVLKAMVVKEIKARYAGSVLGPLWVIISPLYQIFLYTFLFSVIMKVRFEEGAGTSSFVVFLLAGLIPWLFFSEATLKGTSTFIENAHIIKKVKFPVEVCVASVIVCSAVTFFVYMIFYLAMLVIMGLLRFDTLPFFIIPFVLQVLLIAGFSFGLGSVAVFFRDVTQITGMALNLIFFMTPIVYPPSSIPAKVRWVFDVNPFYSIVEMYRNALLRGRMPDPVSIVYPLAVAATVFFVGYYFFRKTKEAFKDIL